MPELLSIASELLLHICDHLDSWALQNISRCNRRLYELTEGHRYASISFHDFKPSITTPHFPSHPLVFLLKILVSPRLAHFTTVLTLGPWKNPLVYPKVTTPGPWTSRESREGRQFASAKWDLLYEVCTVLSSSGSMPADKIDVWYKAALHAGFPEWEPIIALIFELCPNIQTINFRDHSFRGGLADELFEKMSLKASLQSAVPPSAPTVLSKLSDVSFHSYCLEQYEDIRLLVQLGSLPSVKVLSAENLVWWKDLIPPQDLVRCTGLQQINFQRSTLSTDVLVTLLEGSPGLKSFKYEHTNQLEWHPTQIIDALRENTKDSLESLDMTSSKPFSSFPLTGGFHDFTALRTVRLDTYQLDPQYQRQRQQDILASSVADTTGQIDTSLCMPSMRDVLPSSIEKVAFVGIANEEQLETLLNNIIAEKARLPSLHKIQLEDVDPISACCYPSNLTVNKLETLGVEVKVIHTVRVTHGGAQSTGRAMVRQFIGTTSRNR